MAHLAVREAALKESRTVYIIFDPAGIWELGPAVYASREAAQRVADQDNARPGHYPGYSLRVEEYEVQE